MKAMMRRNVRMVFGMAIVSASFGLQGADVFWSGATSTDWFTPSNWSGGSVPGSEDVAVIDPLQQAVTRWEVQLTNAVSVAGLRFTNLTQSVQGSASGTYALTVPGNASARYALTVGTAGIGVSGNQVTLSCPYVAATQQTWSVASDAELIVSGELRGTALLVKSGTGRVWLSGQSLFTGSYRVEAGVLKGLTGFGPPVLSGLKVWLDAGARNTIITNSSGSITTWSNRVGFSAMTTAGGTGPLFITNALNGKPAARFVSSSNHRLVMESGYSNTTNLSTVFVLYQRRDAQTLYAGVLSMYKNGEQDWNTQNGFSLALSAAKNIYCSRYSKTTPELLFSAERPICLMSRFNGVSHRLVEDNYRLYADLTDVKMTGSFNADRLCLGNRPVSNFAYPFNGDISEVLVYNRVLTADEEQSVYSYLWEKWQQKESLGALLADAAVHMDASVATSVITNASGRVTACSNRVSTTALTIPATNECVGPLWVANAMNGRPVLRFAKADKTALVMEAGYTNLGAQATAFVVMRYGVSGSDYDGVLSVFNATGFSDHDNSGRALLIAARYADYSRWYGHRNTVQLSRVDDIPNATPVCLMSSFDGLKHTMAVNGAAAAPVASSGFFNANRFSLGARPSSTAGIDNFCNGDIAEVVLYNRALSARETALVNAYLRDKWQQPSTNTLDALLVSAQLWLDASDSGTLATNESGQVTGWTNRISTVQTLLPPAGLTGPTLVANGMNGRTVLRFNKDATPKQSLVLSSGYLLTNQATTAIVLMQRRATQATNARLLAVWKSGALDYNTTDGGVFVTMNGSTVTSWYGYRNSQSKSAVTGLPAETPTCLISRFDGNNHRMVVDGSVLCTNVASSETFNANRLALGNYMETGANPFNGDVAEVLVFDYALSPDQYQMISAYLKAKWIDAPAGTPVAALRGAQSFEVVSGAELDASETGGLSVQSGGRLSGSGMVRGSVTVETGGRIEAMNQGTGILGIIGDLAFQNSATVAVDYAGGGLPLIQASGALTLPNQMTFATINLNQVFGYSIIPVLKGASWNNGTGGAPNAVAWILQSQAGGVLSCVLDAATTTVNLRKIRGTLIRFQ